MKNSYARFLTKRVHRSIVSVFSFFFIIVIMMLLPGNLKKVYAEEGSIYLNGEKGNDNNDGETEETAVKTFKKAKEMASENPDISIIYVSGKVAVSGELSLEGTSAILKRAPGYGDYLLEVAKGEELTLQDITIDGGEENENKTRKSLIYVNGTLNIEEGTILENNFATDPESTNVFGGAVYAEFFSPKKTINMRGGIIRNNSAYMGGGVFLGSNATFNMSGGTISNNKANPGKDAGASGGGIAAFQSSTINISGDSLITGNMSEEIGGGISVGTYYDTLLGNTLNMNGGIISENISGSCGGGIYVQSSAYEQGYSVANINSGQIIDNTMSGTGNTPHMFGGGGIYVNGENPDSGRKNGILNLNYAVIKENSAEIAGGGYASCPVSLSSINVKNGVAIFNNQATRAGDIDIESGLFSFGRHNGFPTYYISAFMPGGTPYNWKNDRDEVLPLNKLNGVLDATRFEILGLHTDVTEDSASEYLADVIISGNISKTRGGGIGSNGTVNMGERKVIELKVTKDWKFDNPDTRPSNITIELYRENKEDPENPVYIGSETMKEVDGKWELIFKNIPKVDENNNLYRYFVKESPIEGYAVKVSGNQKTGFTIINIPETSIRVEKKWNGESANQVEIKLLADGVVKEKVKLTEAEQWTHYFNKLPRFNEFDGNEIVYTVEEVALSGYSSSISGDQKDGYIVTNTKNPTPTPDPDPNPNPNPNPRPNPSPNPGPNPDPNPTPTTPSTSTTPPPTVAGIFKPIPTPSEIVENSPAPEVLGEYRPAAVKNKRNIPTEDASHLLLWASLFGISGTALLVYIAQKSRRIRRRKTSK